MTLPRHVTRHLLATITTRINDGLTEFGWIAPPINFGTTAVTLIDTLPVDRNDPIAENTVSITLGEVGQDTIRQLGSGLWSREYPFFIDIFGATLSITHAIADDIRLSIGDPETTFHLTDQTTGLDVEDGLCTLEAVYGPEEPIGATGASAFRSTWRMMRVILTLEFSDWTEPAGS